MKLVNLIFKRKYCLKDVICFFNERGSRCSCSTSRIGCVYACPTCSWETLKSKYYGFWMPNWLTFLRSNSKFITHVPHMHMGMCTCCYMKLCTKTWSKELISNLIVELWWLLNTESAQLFLCGWVCVSGATPILSPSCPMCKWAHEWTVLFRHMPSKK